MLDLKSLVPWGQKSPVPVKREVERNPFVALRHDMDRLFDNFRDEFAGYRSLGPDESRNGRWSAVTPDVDVEDTDTAVIITAEVPGVDKQDLDVSLAGDVLTIRGEKKHEHEDKDGDRHYVERRFGSFSRALRLPFEAGDQEIEAQFDKGVLTITVPKPSDWQNKTKRIEVKSR